MGSIAQQLREIVRGVCRVMDVEILSGHIRPDHVHLLVSMPPQIAPSRFMQAVKGKSSHKLLMDWRGLRKEFWGRHLWARGYFVATSGNVTEEMITEYIKNQGVEPQDDEFKVTE
jgi:REP-associated tyrosine transposase